MKKFFPYVSMFLVSIYFSTITYAAVPNSVDSEFQLKIGGVFSQQTNVVIPQLNLNKKTINIGTYNFKKTSSVETVVYGTKSYSYGVQRASRLMGTQPYYETTPEESFFIYYVVIGAVILAVLVLLVIAGDTEDDEYEEYKSRSFKQPMLSFKF
jgi:hypothetical protein